MLDVVHVFTRTTQHSTTRNTSKYLMG